MNYWKDKDCPPMTVYRYQRDIPPFTEEYYNLTFLTGVFILNIQLPVCAEPTNVSPVAHYESGM